MAGGRRRTEYGIGEEQVVKYGAAERLLSQYLHWGILSFVFFLGFILLLSYILLIAETEIALYFMLLLTGFLWIGATAVSRHLFVLLKSMIGRKITVLEFLSTQFVMLMLPFFYRKLRKEIRSCSPRRPTDTADGTEG